VSHLQYEDDTLLIGEESMENLLSMKALLRSFKLMFGLKVNFSKKKVGCLGLMSTKIS